MHYNGYLKSYNFLNPVAFFLKLHSLKPIKSFIKAAFKFNCNASLDEIVHSSNL